MLALLRPRLEASLALPADDKGRASEAHEARLPMRFNDLAKRADSRRPIRPAGLRRVGVPRFSRLVRKAVNRTCNGEQHRIQSEHGRRNNGLAINCGRRC